MKDIETRITYWLNAEAQACGIPPEEWADHRQWMSGTVRVAYFRLALQGDDIAREGGLIGKIAAYCFLGWRSQDARLRAQMTGSDDEGQR